MALNYPLVKSGIIADRLNAKRLEQDRKIHNQRIQLRKNWEIIEMRAQYNRAWYPSNLLRSILGRKLSTNA